jgi:hypothetical protein
MILASLPWDVFCVIREYAIFPIDGLYEDYIHEAQQRLLSNWNDFTACCHSLHSVRRLTVYFSLNSDMSIRYIQDEYIFYRITSKIADPSQQVALSLGLIYCRFLFADPCQFGKLVHKMSIRCNNEHVCPSSLSFLSGIPVVHITGLTGVTEDHLSALAHSTTVNLSSCKSSGPLRVDLHSLSNVRYIGFNECPFIEDVSCLAGCQVMHLNSLTSVTNVSSLKNVRAVRVSFCENIKDLSNLQHVRFLRVEQSFVKLQGLSKLLYLCELDLRGSPGVSLPEFPENHPLRHLTLHFCHVDVLSQVKNKNVVVTCLGGYSSAPTLAEFSRLNLIFFDLEGLCGPSLFQAKLLTLTNCNNILAGSLRFNCLEKISFSQCQMMCENIDEYCPMLKHVSFHSVNFRGVMCFDGTCLQSIFLDDCAFLTVMRIRVKLKWLTVRKAAVSTDFFEIAPHRTVIELSQLAEIMKVDETCKIVEHSI